ncbi:MAG: hypothetical protein Q4P16_07720 [Spirochaetales bacterium]|nr:hypothetical protein [Spirochaetales bacterium]
MTREKNDLKQWIKYFLVGIAQTAEEGTCTLQKIMQLKSKVEETIMTMGKRYSVAHTLLLGLFKNPVASIKNIQNITGLSAKAAGDLAAVFVEKGILEEITKQQRSRIFVFHEYLKLFSS